MTKGGILDAMAKPEFAHGMAQIGAGTQNFENLFRRADNQIQVQQPDPLFLQRRELMNAQIEKQKADTAARIRAENAWRGLTSPRDVPSMDIGPVDPDELSTDMIRRSPLQTDYGLTAPQASAIGAMGPDGLPKLTEYLLKKPTDERTSIQKNLIAAGFTPGTPEYQAALKRYIEKSGTTVNVGGDSYKPQTEAAKVRYDIEQLKKQGVPEGDPVIKTLRNKMKKIGEPTSAQSIAGGFADRMESAEAVLSTLDVQGTSLSGRVASYIPGGNYLQSEEYQQFDQAKRNFVNAQLRRESGAVINPEEFENADLQYFPVPGDKPKVIAQKRANRRDAIRAMKRGAGVYFDRTAKPGKKMKILPGNIPPGSTLYGRDADGKRWFRLPNGNYRKEE